MKLKTLILSVAVLAVLSAVVFFATRPKPRLSDDPRIGKPLVEPAALDALARLKLSHEGRTVEIEKQDSGSWRVTSYHGFPADFAKLSTFVGDLSSAKVEQRVTANPDKLKRLGFADTQVQLSDSAGKPLSQLTLGKNADAGGRFLRFGDEPVGYRAAFSAWLDAESRNWVDSSLVAVKAEDVREVEITLPGAAPVVVRRAKKEERFAADAAPAGQTLKADRIDSLLSSLTSLRFSDTAALDDANAVAARQNQRTVKLTTFDGRTITVSLGRKPEQTIIKPQKPDGTSGPAALGGIADLTKAEAGAPAAAGDDKGPAKVIEPAKETIPAGPVFVSVTDSDPQAAINEMMKRRAFQVFEYAFTSLPASPDELFEPAAPTSTAARESGAASAPSPASEGSNAPSNVP